MIRWATYRWRLLRAEWVRDRCDRHYNSRFAEAKKRGADRQELDVIDSAAAAEGLLYRDDVLTLQTRFLVSRAYTLGIPFEPKAEDWQDNSGAAGRHLQVAALSALRVAVRKEEAERRQAWLAFVPLAFGIIGSITGLVAVFKK